MLDKKKSNIRGKFAMWVIYLVRIFPSQKGKKKFQSSEICLRIRQEKIRALQTTVTTLIRRIKTLSRLLKLLRSKH
ncbi:unnamed protein product [Acanthoscelides obtectus]|uniref:Uncharacterized protein n=1 Tax=Acanthoscelides obtectus TaxID=200917 RepID=A0A9P0K8G6_ACAOB|nr:unnamed protein product [Acanthoscelides obtectus]CAK1671963.1 hypothetical protein AOBTE_LOCUS28571 [Acanthoscelides obtectus]